MPASSRASRARDAREIDSLNRKVAALEAQLQARGVSLDSPNGASGNGPDHERYPGSAPDSSADSPANTGSDAVLIDTIGSLAIAGEDRTVGLFCFALPFRAT